MHFFVKGDEDAPRDGALLALLITSAKVMDQGSGGTDRLSQQVASHGSEAAQQCP
jgi:hypothetical protein